MGTGEAIPVVAPSSSSGLFRSLQQAQSVTSQDLLIAVDACEELLQEVDITPFLLALCGHIRVLPQAPPSPGPLSPGPFSSSIEEGPEPRERAVLASESRLGLSLSDVSGVHKGPVNRDLPIWGNGHARSCPHTKEAVASSLASCSHPFGIDPSLLPVSSVLVWSIELG